MKVLETEGMGKLFENMDEINIPAVREERRQALESLKEEVLIHINPGYRMYDVRRIKYVDLWKRAA